MSKRQFLYIIVELIVTLFFSESKQFYIIVVRILNFGRKNNDVLFGIPIFTNIAKQIIKHQKWKRCPSYQLMVLPCVYFVT